MLIKTYQYADFSVIGPSVFINWAKLQGWTACGSLVRVNHTIEASSHLYEINGCCKLTVRAVGVIPAGFLHQARAIPQQRPLLRIILEAAYESDAFAGSQTLTFEHDILERDKILVVGSSSSIPFSTDSPVTLVEGVIANYGVGVVECVQDESTIAALGVVVCLVDLLALHTFIKTDEDR